MKESLSSGEIGFAISYFESDFINHIFQFFVKQTRNNRFPWAKYISPEIEKLFTKQMAKWKMSKKDDFSQFS